MQSEPINANAERRSRDFRVFLQEELVRRCRKNPGYSLRAFAKVLQIDFSALSKILSGKRSIGPKIIVKLCARLQLGPEVAKQFLISHSFRNTGLNLQSEAYHRHSLDTFQVISDWHHYAILALLRVDHFKPDLRWIAKSLAISPSEARAAVERLERVKLLEVDPKGGWKDLSGGSSTTVGHDFTAAAFRNLQRQVLEKAISALEEIPFEERDQSSMTMAADSSRIPEAKERIQSFRRELAQFLSAGKRRDRIFNLSVSLYPISRKKEK